jgi:Mn2+/Fe2+ NRAMP family transporter
MSSPSAVDPASDAVSLIQAPPTTIPGILRRLGPGLIIAGSIVGSGELIGTTKTGAEAGFTLLWLILIGCMIKVFTQVELGRYTIAHGRTALAGMNEVPGPRLRVNWLVWYWVAMFLVGLGQLGGIVGGVGQAMALSFPVTGDFRRLLDEQKEWDQQAAGARLEYLKAESADLASPSVAVRRDALRRVDKRLVQFVGRPRPTQKVQRTRDDVVWAALITAVTVALLVMGRYRFIQNASTAMVAAFTLVSIFCVGALQTQPDWAIRASDLAEGFSFRLPSPTPGALASPLATCLATFGIIGVGASELVAYPYWCLEQGYARFTGPRDQTPSWAERARGWLRVMQWDAWCSMVVYTFATIAFYLLGASVLARQGLNPREDQMIRTLAEMYVPVFGRWTEAWFLFGAFAVLYSTFFVANAGHARVATDCMTLLRFVPGDDRSRRRSVRILSGVFPITCLAIFYFVPDPTTLVLISGAMQAIMLPMLAAATLYFRYRRCDERIRPSRFWDVCLWLSAAGLLVAGGWLLLIKIFPNLQLLG